jgi:hypothetical protein
MGSEPSPGRFGLAAIGGRANCADRQQSVGILNARPSRVSEVSPARVNSLNSPAHHKNKRPFRRGPRLLLVTDSRGFPLLLILPLSMLVLCVVALRNRVADSLAGHRRVRCLCSDAR